MKPEMVTKAISLYNISDLEQIASNLASTESDDIKKGIRMLWQAFSDSKQDPDIWPGSIRQWILIQDQKPNAVCGYFTVKAPLKGWDSYGDIEYSSYDITEAVCKLTGDTYRKDGTIKVGSSSAAGWSFRGHLEERIMRSL